MEKKFLTAEEAAELFGVSPEKIRALGSEGQIKPLVDLGTQKFRRADLEELLGPPVNIPRSSDDSDSYFFSNDISFLELDEEALASAAPGAKPSSQENSSSASDIFSFLNDDEEKTPVVDLDVSGLEDSKASSSDVVISPASTSGEVIAPPGSSSDVIAAGSTSSDVITAPGSSSDVIVATGQPDNLQLGSASSSDVMPMSGQSVGRSNPSTSSDVMPLDGDDLLDLISEGAIDLVSTKSSSKQPIPADLTGGPSDSAALPEMEESALSDLLDVSSIRGQYSDSGIVLASDESGITFAPSGVGLGSGLGLGTADSGLSLAAADLPSTGDPDSGIRLPDLPDSGLSLAGQDSGLTLDTGDSGLSIAPQGTAPQDGDLSLSTGDSGLSLDIGDSGLSLAGGDSGLSLAGADSGLSLSGGDSGLSLDAGDSGLSLQSGDSGLSLQIVPDDDGPRPTASSTQRMGEIPEITEFLGKDENESSGTRRLAKEEQFRDEIDFVEASKDDETGYFIVDEETTKSPSPAAKSGKTTRSDFSDAYVVEESVQDLDISDEISDEFGQSVDALDVLGGDDDIFEASDENFSDDSIPAGLSGTYSGETAAVQRSSRMQGYAEAPWGMLSASLVIAAAACLGLNSLIVWEAVSTMWTGAEPSGLAGSLVATLGGLL
jgi:hypothetical protein